mmetsp:Transcript_18258/g.25965  ORF Transcript_18258/g.25965 Transcript_18258/m.25965 type:complete len:442 (-) Transcript_18258:134-1459(-)
MRVVCISPFLHLKYNPAFFFVCSSGDVKNPSIRLLALQLLIREGEKRPDMLRQRVCAGIREAFLFQRGVIPRTEQVTAVTLETDECSGAVRVECIFGLLYKECLSTSKVIKQALFKSLIRLFLFSGFVGEGTHVADSDACDKGSVQRKKRQENQKVVVHPAESSFDLPLLCYASQMLAHLPYTASMDPLFIIHHVSNAITVHGEPLLNYIVRFLGPHLAEIGGVENEDDEDISLEEDVLEKAAKSKTPSRTKAARVLENSNFDFEFFAQLCAKAATMILLLRLKQFLKKVYSLSEARCTEYTPCDKDKFSDKSINIPEEIPIFNNKFEGLIQDSSSPLVLDKDALIRVYAEFRRLMRTAGSEKEKSNSDKPTESAGFVESATRKDPLDAKGATSQQSGNTGLVNDDIMGNIEACRGMKVTPKTRSNPKRAAVTSSKRQRKE